MAILRGLLSLSLVLAGAKAAAQRAPWTVASAPTVAIGSLDGDLTSQFDRVTGALRLPNGTIIVGNTGSSELRFFDGQGNHLKSAGGRGAGPGEFGQFSSLKAFQLGNDRIIVQDAESQRVNVFDHSGKFLRQFRFEPRPAAARVTLVAVTDAGIVARSIKDAGLRGAPGTRIVSAYQYAIFDSMGAQKAPLFELGSRPRLVHAYQGRTHYPFVPLTADPAVAASSDRVYVIHGDSAVIEVWSFGGKRVGTLSWSAQRSPVRDIWSRYTESELALITQPRDRTLYGHYYEMDLPLPKFLPIATQLHIDAVGNLWVERFKLPWEKERRWDVLETGGRFLGTTSAPGSLELHQVGANFLLARVRDSLGVESVQVWPLTKRP